MKKKKLISVISKAALSVLLLAGLIIVGNPAKEVDAATLTVKSDEYPLKDSSILANHIGTAGNANISYTDVMAIVKDGAGKYTYTDNSGNTRAGTISESMCTIYDSNGAQVMSGANLRAGDTFTLHIQYGTDSTTGADQPFTVTTVSKIDWPTSLPTTHYLAGAEWNTDGAVIKVTYANGYIKNVPVKPEMLYLAETVKSARLSHNYSLTANFNNYLGDVIGYQDSSYSDGFKNNINDYRLVLCWNGYNSASNYGDCEFPTSVPSSALWGFKNSQALYADYRCQHAISKSDAESSEDNNLKALTAPLGANLINNGLVKISSNAVRFYDVTVSAASEYLPEIKYSAHVQNIGWQGFFYSPNTAGTTGQSRRMEAIVFDIENLKTGFGGVNYQVHVQNKGWMDVMSTGQVAGTTGESLRMEAIRINLTGQYADKYDIQYRVHVQTTGWTEWVSNGETAGTVAQSKRLEAIEVRVVPKK